MRHDKREHFEFAARGCNDCFFNRVDIPDLERIERHVEQERKSHSKRHVARILKSKLAIEREVPNDRKRETYRVGDESRLFEIGDKMNLGILVNVLVEDEFDDERGHKLNYARGAREQEVFERLKFLRSLCLLLFCKAFLFGETVVLTGSHVLDVLFAFLNNLTILRIVRRFLFFFKDFVFFHKIPLWI